jgi:sporulation protein YlmC with PRC-barrel domain
VTVDAERLSSQKEKRMNRIKTVTVMLSIASMLCVPALFAQQRERPIGQTPGAAPSRPGMEEPVTPRATTPEPPPVPKASTFIGSSVVNAEGDSLGKIEDLVIDPATGRITYAALSRGSILGIGGKLFAVSWDAFEMQPDGKTFVLNVPKETLESAPGFDKSNWPKQPDPMLSASARGTGTGAKPSTPSTQAGNAAGAGVSATVQEVNAQTETIKLKTAQGESMELQAPAAMLTGLAVGDAVEVKMTGMRATEIRKKE